ncbi:hypothetical protein [Dyadobacter psychrotolerans]|uniref:Uncharacterized protein n=1 Tax=Dyadobacter psychrotolerans TaxID=2541721 RepID=A0A4R5DCW2_9BACT|nr:hypothetical protein [Dyadobacter psychrotolerans]TDE09830.1 hypothetical protein E0F88_30020 [Dyadobacter psychrotolerans]
METAIQTATKHFRSLNCVNTVDNNRTSIPSHSVESTLLKFGSDAFEPIILDIRGSGSELVPKMRLHFTTKEWFGLDFSYRLFIMKAFYDNL